MIVLWPILCFVNAPVLKINESFVAARIAALE